MIRIFSRIALAVSKLWTRLFLGICVVLLISFSIISSAIYNIFFAQSLANVKEFLSASTSQMIVDLDLNLQRIKDLSVDLYFHHGIQRQLERDYAGDFTTYDERMSVLKELDSLIRSTSNARVVYIYSVKGPIHFSYGPPANVSSMQDLSRQPWFPLVQGSGGKFVFIPRVEHYLLNQKDDILLLAREIMSEDLNRVLGYQVIAIDPSFMKNDLERSLFALRGAVAVDDPQRMNAVTYEPGAGKDTDELLERFHRLISESHEQSDSGISMSVVDNRYIFVRSGFAKTGFRLYGIIPIKEVTAGFKETWFSVLVAVGTGFVFAFLFTFFFSRTISQPILLLTKAIRSVQSGRTYHRIPRFKLHEADQIGLRFNEMMDRLEAAIERITEEKVRNRELQFQMLLAQINPHFLHNTLYSIYWMVKLDKDRDVTADMLSSLSKLLKYGLDDQRVVVTVEEEMEYLSNYLYIQKQRFQDKLNFRLEVSPTLNGLPIQKLVFQPIVENCIHHVIEGKGSVTVRLRGDLQGGDACFEIADDGAGIPRNKLTTIQALLEDFSHGEPAPPPSDAAIGKGMLNVHQRIRLTYGPNYGLTVHSTERGTTVRICIPGNPR